MNLTDNLALARCPHCFVAHPNLQRRHHLETIDHAHGNRRLWFIYACAGCGGVVSAWSRSSGNPVGGFYPAAESVDETIPDRPRAFLQQAMETKHAPAGSVMLSASAVDEMLKLKSYTSGSLYARIEQAVKDHVITADMAAWAHDVRLDANDQRHADQLALLPTESDASRVLDFALALAEILFVLPARVQRGRSSQPKPAP